MPFFVKIGYGTAELGIISVEMILRLYLLIYYTDTIKLRPDLAGYAVALAVIWDAITDPLIGIFSDSSSSRWGKRRPYIFFGGVFLAFFLIILLYPPNLNNQYQKFFYLLISYIAVNTSMTILSIPHAALGGELTDNASERTQLYGWRFFFANVGALLGTVLPNGYIIAIVVVSTSTITCLVTKNRDVALAEPMPDNFLFSIPQTLKNKMFRYLFLSYVVATIGLGINSTLAIYYYKYRLKLQQNEIETIIGLFILTICISILFWVAISNKHGKKWPAFWGIFGLGVMTIVGYPFFPEKQIVFPLCAAILGGILAGSTVLLDSLVADCVDCEAESTGKKREGLYFGVWRMGAKIARAAAIALCGIWLHKIGFQANLEQSITTTNNIAWMFGLGVGIFLLLASVIFSFLPLKSVAKRH